MGPGTRRVSVILRCGDGERAGQSLHAEESMERRMKQEAGAREQETWKAAAGLPYSTLGYGMAIVCGITAGGVVLELAFDVGQHAARAEAKKIGF